MPIVLGRVVADTIAVGILLFVSAGTLEWRRAWMRNYALKPAKAVELDEYYAKRIKAKFGPKMSYTDVHTAVAPWEYVDFDARVPGAGTIAATFYAYGQLLLNDQRVYGIAQSEATFQWLYAGLDSGSYGWVYTDVNLLTHPLDVSFKLMKIQPLQVSTPTFRSTHTPPASDASRHTASTAASSREGSDPEYLIVLGTLFFALAGAYSLWLLLGDRIMLFADDHGLVIRARSRVPRSGGG